MKLFKVFHNKEFLACPFSHWGTKVMPKPENLTLVAIVNAPDLDDVFKSTNHMDRPWDENPNLMAFGRTRSTSCGDVIEDDTGTRYVVASTGFKVMACQ